MAWLNAYAMRRLKVKNTLSVTAVSIALFLIGSLIWIFYGAPIHDWRLWMLKQAFSHANIHHPVESVWLGRRDYLGPSPYGSRCVYATGEVRSTTLEKKDILNAYQNTNVGKLPLNIYFIDESELPYEVPFGDWRNGLRDINIDTTYIVYIVTKHHFLGDLRCDD